MPIHWIYRDVVPVGSSAPSLLLTVALLFDDAQGPPPPHTHTLIHHFGHAGLRRAQIHHIDIEFSRPITNLRHTEPSTYARSLWLGIAGSCCNMVSSIAPVHTGTKTEVARISKQFSHRLVNFDGWQGSCEYSESTPWPPLHAPLKAGMLVSDQEDVEAHHRLLVRPVLNPAVEVSRGEVAKVNFGKRSEYGEIEVYDGPVTAMSNEIKMLRYNVIIVEVPGEEGGFLVHTSCVCCLKGYLAPFMDTMGIWSRWNNTYLCN